MKLLLLLCVAVVVEGQRNPEQNEYKIELVFSAGTVSLDLKADGPFNKTLVIKVSIIFWLILYRNYLQQNVRVYRDGNYKATFLLLEVKRNGPFWLLVSWKQKLTEVV